MSRTKLTVGQRHALTLLSELGALRTTAKTGDGSVSGTVATSLERLYLVASRYPDDGPRVVEITDRGRRALLAAGPVRVRGEAGAP